MRNGERREPWSEPFPSEPGEGRLSRVCIPLAVGERFHRTRTK
ncbi:hypothetical protein [Haloarcula sediminis]|nr:hypothetical protein [Haloarcula sp. CK38]